MLLIITVFLVAVAVTACGAAQPTVQIAPTQQTDDFVMALALSTLDNPFFVSMQKGAEEAANRTHTRLLVVDAKDDAGRQAKQIQQLIEQSVDALLVNPVDGEAIVESIKAANSANIPVITLDRSANGGKIVTHIASDNVAGGEMAADYLAEILGKRGKVVELEGSAGTSAAADRGAGFNQAMLKYPNIEIVARQSANFNRSDGRTVFAQILKENPEIDGVFAHNDDMVLGAIDAAKQERRMDDIKFVGFDAIDLAVSALEKGDLEATIAQQPAEMGRLGVEMAAKYLHGESLPDYIPVDLALLTQ
ncbi:MAG: D-ribose ABC transporter substrate-binding protein [Chloroflexi bacterium]|nr:MAG: D-ribose ABC transporter substrate-binding protein [Chloroflexota bacterium]